MTTGVSHIASNRQHRLSDQVLANTFKTQVRDITRRTRGISLPQLIEERGHTSLDGAATSASARPRVCSPTWKRGSAEDYARIFGGNGRTGTIASMNCAVVAYRSSMQRLRRFADRFLAHVRTPGGPTGPAQPLFRLTRSPPTPCLCPNLTQSNRRGTRPVCPVLWEGWHREVSPYPDQ